MKNTRIISTALGLTLLGAGCAVSLEEQSQVPTPGLAVYPGYSTPNGRVDGRSSPQTWSFTQNKLFLWKPSAAGDHADPAVIAEVLSISDDVDALEASVIRISGEKQILENLLSDPDTDLGVFAEEIQSAERAVGRQERRVRRTQRRLDGATDPARRAELEAQLTEQNATLAEKQAGLTALRQNPLFAAYSRISENLAAADQELENLQTVTLPEQTSELIRRVDYFSMGTTQVELRFQRLGLTPDELRSCARIAVGSCLPMGRTQRVAPMLSFNGFNRCAFAESGTDPRVLPKRFQPDFEASCTEYELQNVEYTAKGGILKFTVVFDKGTPFETRFDFNIARKDLVDPFGRLFMQGQFKVSHPRLSDYIKAWYLREHGVNITPADHARYGVMKINTRQVSASE